MTIPPKFWAGQTPLQTSKENAQKKKRSKEARKRQHAPPPPQRTEGRNRCLRSEVGNYQKTLETSKRETGTLKDSKAWDKSTVNIYIIYLGIYIYP